jgi:hypothetical protein
MKNLNKSQMLFMNGYVPANIDDIYEYADGGIHIDPSKKGTFTAAATKHGESVQGFASQVLANKEDYSPAMVKKANFARNAAHWKHQQGGPAGGQEDQVMQLIQTYAQLAEIDPNQLMQQLQKMQPEQQKAALQKMAEQVQQTMSQQAEDQQYADEEMMAYGGTPEYQGGGAIGLGQEGYFNVVPAMHTTLQDSPLFGFTNAITGGLGLASGLMASGLGLAQGVDVAGRLFDKNPNSKFHTKMGNIQNSLQRGIDFTTDLKTGSGSKYTNKGTSFQPIMQKQTPQQFAQNAISQNFPKPQNPFSTKRFDFNKAAPNLYSNQPIGSNPFSNAKTFDTDLYHSGIQNFYQEQGGEMIKRADGSYSRRGLWDNIRANKGSGKKPTKEMLEQERKIKSQEYGGMMADGGEPNNPGFNALPEYVQEKIINNMATGGELPKAQFGKDKSQYDEDNYYYNAPQRNNAASGFVDGMGMDSEYGYGFNEYGEPTNGTSKYQTPQTIQYPEYYQNNNPFFTNNPGPVSGPHTKADKQYFKDTYPKQQYPGFVDRNFGAYAIKGIQGLGVTNSIFDREEQRRQMAAYNAMQMRRNNSDSSNVQNAKNPFGNYTLNVGPSQNFQLSKTGHVQDYGTSYTTEYGGQQNFEAGGEYQVSHDELLQLMRDGAEIEFL